jgi:hypothetical protein
MEWGGDFMVTRGKTSRLTELDGFVAEVNGIARGLITFKTSMDELEITSINC